jgi:hypothetical protein
MSSFEDHCAESKKLFGERFEEVHRWLDVYAGTEDYGYKHRRKRHHAEGIREVIRLFGEKAGKVAKRHIISDLMEEGWTEKDRFPENEEDYVKMGFF